MTSTKDHPAAGIDTGTRSLARITRMRFWDQHLFGDSRNWACGQATGKVLEVAIGIGLNLAAYPQDITLTGIDLSDPMLDIARDRAAELRRTVILQQGDAHALPFTDGTQLQALTGQHIAIRDGKAVITDTAA